MLTSRTQDPNGMGQLRTPQLTAYGILSNFLISDGCTLYYLSDQGQLVPGFNNNQTSARPNSAMTFLYHVLPLF